MSYLQSRGRLSALLLVTLLLPFALANAQPMAASGQEEELSPELIRLQTMQQEIQTMGQQLQQIQQQALANNPELQGQQEALQELVVATMKEQGFDFEPAVRSLTAIESQLRSQTLEPAEQQALSLQYQTEGQALQTAQNAAMSAEAVVAARSELETVMIAAMNEVNPETEQMIADLQQAQAEFQTLVQQQMGTQ